jgi:hypothetical protein
VQRLRKIVGFDEVASPEIPTRGVSFRRVAKPVDRYDIGLNVSTDSDLQFPRTWEGRNADAIA